MNNFMIYIDGVLAPPDVLNIKTGNSAQYGRFADVTRVEPADDSDKKTTRVMAKSLKPEFIDVMEVRAGSVVRRYHYSDADGAPVTGKATEDSPAFTRWRCMSVVNAF